MFLLQQKLWKKSPLMSMDQYAVPRALKEEGTKTKGFHQPSEPSLLFLIKDSDWILGKLQSQRFVSEENVCSQIKTDETWKNSFLGDFTSGDDKKREGLNTNYRCSCHLIHELEGARTVWSWLSGVRIRLKPHLCGCTLWMSHIPSSSNKYSVLNTDSWKVVPTGHSTPS